MKEYNGVVKNITQKIIVDGVTHTTPVYDVEYTCRFSDGTLYDLVCNEHIGVVTIPHKGFYSKMCTSQDFMYMITQAYPDKELIHIVCERFFRQYNELDVWGTPRVLKMCDFELYDTRVNEDNFDQILSEYDYYYTTANMVQIIQLTHESKHDLIGKKIYLIKRKQQ